MPSHARYNRLRRIVDNWALAASRKDAGAVRAGTYPHLGQSPAGRDRPHTWASRRRPDDFTRSSGAS